MSITKQPKTAAFLAAAVIGVIAATGSSKGIATGFSRLWMIAMATGCGFALGWFLSPSAKSARRLVLYALGAILLFVAFAGPKGLGWTATMLLATIGFCFGRQGRAGVFPKADHLRFGGMGDRRLFARA